MIACRGDGGGDGQDFMGATEIPVVMAEEGEKPVVGGGTLLGTTNPQQQDDDGCVTYEIEYVDNYDSKEDIARKVNLV